MRGSQSMGQDSQSQGSQSGMSQGTLRLFERFSPRDPSNHLDGLWQYLYPARPTT